MNFHGIFQICQFTSTSLNQIEEFCFFNHLNEIMGHAEDNIVKIHLIFPFD